jgi:hypothetical protein
MSLHGVVGFSYFMFYLRYTMPNNYFFYFLELYEFSEEENGSAVKGIYWNVNFPFPLSNRDVSSNS